ncbi:MAG: hypothetical protein LBD48_12265, partial [Treponema sp.]|nr:hypothetical protein [Treponema sp.]
MVNMFYNSTFIALSTSPAPGYAGIMCWYCGSPVLDEIIGRSLRCAGCGKDLRVCRNCRFFLSG